MNDLQFLFYNSKCEIKYFILTYTTHNTNNLKNLNNWKLRPYKSKIGIKRKWRRGLSNKCRSTSKEPRSSKREQKQYGSEREIAREKERKRMPGKANFILLCLGRQEYLFIAVKVKRSRRMRTEQEAVYKQTKNKPGNQTFRICKYFY